MLRVVRDHIELPQTCAEGCAAPPLLMVVAPHPLNLVCFRHVGGDEPTEALLAALNGTGRVFLTHTRLDGRFVIRVAIGAQATEARHVDGLWELIEQHAQKGARGDPGGRGAYRSGMAGDRKGTRRNSHPYTTDRMT